MTRIDSHPEPFQSADQQVVFDAPGHRAQRSSPGRQTGARLSYRALQHLKKNLLPDGEPINRVLPPGQVRRAKSGDTPQGYYRARMKPVKRILDFSPGSAWASTRTSPDERRSNFDQERLFTLLMKPIFLFYVSDKLGREVRWEPTSRTLTMGSVKKKHRCSKPTTVQSRQAFLRRLDAQLRRWFEANRSSKKVKKRSFSVPTQSPQSEPAKSVPAHPSPANGPIEGGFELETMSLEDRIVLLLAVFAQKMMKQLESKVGSLRHSGGSETQKQAEIQILTQKLTRAMQTLSQVMRAFHEAMTTSIRNIR